MYEGVQRHAQGQDLRVEGEGPLADKLEVRGDPLRKILSDKIMSVRLWQ